VRAGQTEGSVDLARLAGLQPAGVICEIMRDDGQMARMPDLERFAEMHGLSIVTVADLVHYRLQRESLVHRVREAEVHNELGSWRLCLYNSDVDENVHVALVRGEVRPEEPILVRVHAGCVAGEVFGLDSCVCGAQIRRSMELISRADHGVLLYLQQDSMGVSLLRLFDNHVLRTAPDSRAVASEARKPVLREYGVGAQILHDLGVRRMRLLSDHQRLLVALEGYGLEVVELVPLSVEKPGADVVSLAPTRGGR
jgi:3,4-dihydroxy 2-butanone 4-phosphate synthase/GTP cyclohydrolase II